MTRARDLADSADKDIAGTLVVDDITASGTITGDTAGTHTGAVTGNVTGNTAGTHTGAVVGNVTGDLTGNVTGDVIDEANLKVSNAPTNGYFLSAQSGNTGGLTWATPPSGYADSDVDAHLLTAGVTLDATNDKLGVNSTTPLSSMHVKDTGSDNGSLRVGGSGASLGLELTYDQSANTTSIIQANPTYTSANQLLKIRSDGDANPNQLVLKGDSYIGINTASPNTGLHVVGAVNNGDYLTKVESASYYGLKIKTLSTSDSHEQFAIHDGANAVQFKVMGGGTVHATGINLGGSSAANRLNDYETGSFQMSMTGGPSGSVGYGEYVKIGNMCHFQWYSATQSITSVVNPVLSGLPFLAASMYVGSAYPTVSASHNTYAPQASVGYINLGSDSIYFTANGSSGGASTSVGSRYVMCAGTYVVA